MRSRGFVNSRSRWQEPGKLRSHWNSKGNGSGIDWRKNFLSIFVGNLHPDTVSGELWKRFSEFGVVCDIFMKSQANHQSAFAFVRYRKEEEINKAIQMSNGSEFRGRIIVVRKAEEGKTKGGGSSTSNVGATVVPEGNKRERVVRAREVQREMSFVEAIRNEGSERVEPRPGNIIDAGHREPGRSSAKYVQVLNIKVDYVDDQPEWLFRSLVGKMKEFKPLSELCAEFERNGIPVSVSPLGGLSILITFHNRELMEYLLEQHMDFFEQNFSNVRPWEEDFVCEDMFLWISLTGIPIQFWREGLFKEIGNCWGTFISSDVSTSKRFRLDQARILVAANSKMVIPSSLMIKCKGKSFLVKISHEPAYDFIQMSSDKKFPDAGGVPMEEIGDFSATKEDEQPTVGLNEGEHVLLHGEDVEVKDGGSCMDLLIPEANVGRVPFCRNSLVDEECCFVSPIKAIGPVGVTEHSEQAWQEDESVVKDSLEVVASPILENNEPSPLVGLIPSNHGLVLEQSGDEGVKEGVGPSLVLCLRENDIPFDSPEYRVEEEKF